MSFAIPHTVIVSHNKHLIIDHLIMMTSVAPKRVLLVVMAFSTCHDLMLSANLIKKYPYWSDYLTDPNAVQINRHITSPIGVWPGCLLENYTKLTVRMKCSA